MEVERGQAARDRKAAEHEALLEYVIAGDAEAAAAVMREHIDTSLGAQAAWRLRKHHTDTDSPLQGTGPDEGDA
ncbi:FCD domain-containing protein [Nonomuraea polychroma]|uniref:FCD domain-containing protein n=1 Tax=Nonomuraea polychroma TaxID=46176 RepID=UPI003D950532